MKEERFKSMFAAFGTVTDCSLKFTKDGRFRKFGFVGFKAEEDANRALKHFNKSFVDTSRVTVWVQSWLHDRTRVVLTFLLTLLLSYYLWTDGCMAYFRWRCARPLGTPLRQNHGANIHRAQARTNPPFMQTLTAKRYLQTQNNWQENGGELESLCMVSREKQ